MEQIIRSTVTGYLLLLGLIGFLMMGIDKRRAVKKVWRIPEQTLIFIAFIGGGIGSMLGMRIFRHKTKHRKFVILLPLAAVLELALIFEIYYVL